MINNNQKLKIIDAYYASPDVMNDTLTSKSFEQAERGNVIVLKYGNKIEIGCDNQNIVDLLNLLKVETKP